MEESAYSSPQESCERSGTLKSPVKAHGHTKYPTIFLPFLKICTPLLFYRMHTMPAKTSTNIFAQPGNNPQ